MLDPNLSRTIQQVIEILAVRLTVPGFGIPLILAAGLPVGLDDVTSYSSTAEMVDAGVSITNLAYKKAAVIFAQDPHPDTVYLAKRKSWTTKYEITVGTIVENEKVYLTLGTAPVITFTAGVGPTPSAAATAIAALITTNTATAGFTAAAVGAVVTITANTANTLPYVGKLSRNLSIKNVTVDPGIEADLVALEGDPSINEWYGLLVDSVGATEFDLVASWVQTNKKFGGLNTIDSGVGKPAVTDDVFSVAKSKSQTRTMGFASDVDYKALQSNQDFIAEGIMGAVFPLDAGSETWKFKNAANVVAGKSRSGWINAVHAKNGNTHTFVQGIVILEDGMMLGGEWADVIRGTDWLDVEIQLAVFGYISAQRKVPYTDLGIDAVVAQIKGALKRGEDRNFLVKGSSRVVAPRAAQVSTADKIARRLTGVKWNGDLAGAIHFVGIEGALSP